MAEKKGPKMIQELVRRRAQGDGFQTIANDLKISRNTVKSRLKDAGAYEVVQAQAQLLSGLGTSRSAVFAAHWSSAIDWGEALSQVEGGTPIKEYWEEHLASATEGGAVLCNSRLFFPLATLNEKQPSWLAGIREGFKYFGGATQLLVVDNTRCAVNGADWFDPDMNQEFYNFCDHYNTTVVAARPGRPKDKNLIEVHLGVFWRWVRRRLRSRQFFSLGELNRFLSEAADEFNNRYQRKYGSSRRERFGSQEKPTLRPLPTTQYETGDWKKAKLHEDCHIQHKYNYYSAPYQHRGKELDVRVTLTHVEIFYQQERVAIHCRRPDNQRGHYSTCKTHLPEKFQAMEEMSVSRQIREAGKIGPNTEKIITSLLTEVSHPLMYLRRTMGILRLKGRHGAGKLGRVLI